MSVEEFPVWAPPRVVRFYLQDVDKLNESKEGRDRKGSCNGSAEEKLCELLEARQLSWPEAARRMLTDPRMEKVWGMVEPLGLCVSADYEGMSCWSFYGFCRRAWLDIVTKTQCMTPAELAKWRQEIKDTAKKLEGLIRHTGLDNYLRRDYFKTLPDISKHFIDNFHDRLTDKTDKEHFKLFGGFVDGFMPEKMSVILDRISSEDEDSFRVVGNADTFPDVITRQDKPSDKKAHRY